MGRLQCELEVSANARKKGINVNLSEVVLFVGLGAIVGFAGGLFAIGGALIAIPFLTARLRLQPTRLAGNGDGDGACQRERDFGDLLAKEALARSR
jgi:hypothetical protein